MKYQTSSKINNGLCSLLVVGFWCLVFMASFSFSLNSAHAVQVTLAWDTSEEAAGYKIYYGTTSNNYTGVVDVGTELTYTFTDLPDGHAYYFAATAYDATHLESDFSTEISYNAMSQSQTEILWRNTSTGQNGVWYMDGVTNTGWGQLPTVSVSSNWTIVGTGDFNADGKTDILWRNTSTGQNGVWYMDGVTNTGWGQLPTVSVSSNWTIAGTGDFNSDGKTDILWRNTSTGQNGVWYMDGVTNTGWGQLPTVSVSSNWTIAGTGDFNSDGKTDILWRNTSTGQNGVWYMDGVTNTGWGQLPTVSVSSNWTIAGTGDFNSDGKTDILWRNTTTGQNGVWYMDGVTNTGWGQLPTVSVSSNWTIAGR